MSLPKRRRSLPILLAMGLASLVGPVQAFAFDCNGSAGPPDAFTQLNNQLYDSDGHQSRLNLCQTTPKTLSVSVATTLGHAHGATTATVNFGLQTVQAALDAKNIVGQLGGGAAYQLTARSSDVITASADTTFKVTSRLLYTGSRVVSNPTQDHNGASGNLQLSGPSISFNEVVTAGPTGSNLALPIMTGLLHLSAGQLIRIQSYLYADIYVDPNGAFEELPG